MSKTPIREKLSKEETEKLIDEMFQPTAENVNRNMAMSRALFIVDVGEGKYISAAAEEWADGLKKYAEYCIESKQKDWNKRIDDIVQNYAGTMRDSEFALAVYPYEAACPIMEKLAYAPWEEVRKLLSEQGHSGYTLFVTSNVISEFSPWGKEFVENVRKDEETNQKKLREEKNRANGGSNRQKR